MAGLSSAQLSADRSDAPARTGAEISALNGEIEAALRSSRPPDSELLRRRRSLLSELMASDPEAAARLSFSEATAAQLGPFGLVEVRGEWTGELRSIVEDWPGHAPSKVRLVFIDRSNEAAEVFFAHNSPRPFTGAGTIRGVRLGNRIAAESFAPSLAATGCSTTGVQKIAVLLVTMPSHPTLSSAFTTSAVYDAFFGAPSEPNNMHSVNGFWKEVSYGLTSAAGQVFGPFALTHDYGFDQATDMAAEAVQVADSAVDFSQFTRVALVFPAPWGPSLGTIGCGSIQSPSRGPLPASITWFPVSDGVSPVSNVHVFAHELGHNLGLGHSSTEDFGPMPVGPLGATGVLHEYGDLYSTMGSIGGHFPAPHKAILQWLNMGQDYREVDSSGSYDLVPYEQTTGLRALRILRDTGLSSWLWVEYRQPIGDVDKAIADPLSNVFRAALVHDEQPGLDALHTYLLHFNPIAAENDFLTAGLNSGQSWSDPYSPLSLAFSNATSSGARLTVSYDSSCAALQFSTTVFGAAGGAGRITVTAPPGCAWTAATSANWITFTGSTAGSGNGAIDFSVAATSNGAQDFAYITVQRQSTRLVRMGTVLSVVDLTPTRVQGASSKITAHLYDTNGYHDIPVVRIDIDRLGGGGAGFHLCTISVEPLYPRVTLDRAPGVITVGIPGATLSNGDCSVDSTGLTLTGSGNDLRVTLPVSFAPSASGSHRISVSASNGAVSTGTVPMGAWTVPVLAAITVSTSPAGRTILVDGAAFTAPRTFNWAVGSAHGITAASPQESSGIRSIFSAWSDGGGQSHVITTPSSATTYTATFTTQPVLSAKVGVYRGGVWYLDSAGSGAMDSTTKSFPLGFPGATYVTGDWNGDGKTKAGVYSNGYWFLDYDGNGVWDGGVKDKLIAWGWAGAMPIVGDWSGDGKTKIGVYSNGFWFLDYNGDYLWDGGVADKQVGWGWAGVMPIVGDWNGDGKTKIGVYVNGFWFLDYDGNYVWDGGVVDKQVGWGWAGVTPIVGDWNGDGKTKIGVYAGGYWYIDYDGNYLWEYPAKDKIWSMGWAGATPVMGDWNGDGKTKPGAFINGYWYLDYNGNGVFDGAGTDRIFAFGASGDTPVVGHW